MIGDGRWTAGTPAWATFRRRLTVGGQAHEVEKTVHEADWVPAQTHIGENIGTTDTHALFVELK